MFGILLALSFTVVELQFGNLLCVHAAATSYSLTPNVESSTCSTDRGLVFEVKRNSTIHCAVECNRNPNCTAFLYNENDRSCLGEKRFPKNSELCTSTSGSKYYRIRCRDCQDIKMADPEAETGIYRVSLPGGGPVQHLDVYCDMETPGVGWTVFQKRFDGSVSFTHNFDQYQNGFGDLNGEFWLGLKWLYLMTSTRELTLRIDMQEIADGTYRYAQYSDLTIGQPETYILNYGTFSGNTSDALAFHKGMSFSTPDKDKDVHGTQNCANNYKSGFWFKNCHRGNVNGLYTPLQNHVDRNGFYWERDNVFRQLKTSNMKFS